jgi:hypothetical protein
MDNVGLYTEGQDGLLHIKFSHTRMIENEFWGTANSKLPWSLWKVNSLLGRKFITAGWKAKSLPHFRPVYELLGGLYPAPTFHMESMWNPCHSMSFQMDSTHSIWNMFWVKSHPNWCFCSMHIPHGMGGIHLESMESIWNIHMKFTWNIPQVFHGFQMDSTWIPHWKIY